jgi:hypothetical protein
MQPWYLNQMRLQVTKMPKIIQLMELPSSYPCERFLYPGHLTLQQRCFAWQEEYYSIFYLFILLSFIKRVSLF